MKPNTSRGANVVFIFAMVVLPLSGNLHAVPLLTIDEVFNDTITTVGRHVQFEARIIAVLEVQFPRTYLITTTQTRRLLYSDYRTGSALLDIGTKLTIAGLYMGKRNLLIEGTQVELLQVHQYQ